MERPAFQGVVEVPYARLVDVFGEPSFCADDEDVFTVFLYWTIKVPDCKNGDRHFQLWSPVPDALWRVYGPDERALIDAVEATRGEGVYAHQLKYDIDWLEAIYDIDLLEALYRNAMREAVAARRTAPAAEER